MSTEATKAILDHHQAALDAGDVDDLMSDYTEDSVFVTNLGGVVKGLDGIRAIFGATAGGMAGFELLGEHVDGDVAYIWWKAENIPAGTDTFVVRDGKIAAQTVYLQLG
jgi:ketosteroid isomerase-like protein